MSALSAILALYVGRVGLPIPRKRIESVWNTLPEHQRAHFIITDIQCGALNLATLIALGANLDFALHYAVKSRHYAAIRMLCEARANGNQEAAEGQTPIVRAIHRKDVSAVALLYEMGATLPPELVTEMESENPGPSTVKLRREMAVYHKRTARCRDASVALVAVLSQLGLPKALAAWMVRRFVWQSRRNWVWDDVAE